MILVVEGANKVGKTTVINKLKEMYGEQNVINVYERQENDEILHKGRKMFKFINYAVGMSNIRYLRILDDMHPDKLLVLDRFHLTELVYGEMHRHYNAHDTFRELDKHLFNIDAKLLLICSNFKHIHDEEEARRLMAIQENMQKAYRLSLLTKTQIAYTDEADFDDTDLLYYSLQELRWSIC